MSCPRYVKRLYDDIEDKLKSVKDMVEYKELGKLSKLISAIMSICKFVSGSGLSAPELVTVLDQQAQFLKMDPAVEPRSWGL